MYELLIIAFLVIAVAIIGLVLIQKGKGADMGASFGAGASATLFGSSGSGNFLSRTTTVLGVLFFIVSLALANLGSKKTANDGGFADLGKDNASTVIQQGTSPSSLNEIDGQIPLEGSITSPQSTTTINSTSDIPE